MRSRVCCWITPGKTRAKQMIENLMIEKNGKMVVVFFFMRWRIQVMTLQHKRETR